MDRRAFVRGLFGVAAAGAVVAAVMPTQAEAAMPVLKPEPGEANRQESDYRPDVDGVPSTENAQYYYRRRRRFRRRVWRRRRPVFYRRRAWRPRRRVYRRAYYRRPVYYRPVYRPRYYW